jgi:hypothetical protein
MTPQQQLALDLWKSTLEAHDRQWGNYVILAFGVLAFLAAVRTDQLANRWVKESLFFGVLFFMVVSAVTMWQNLLIHNDATRAIRLDPILGKSAAFDNVHEMSPYLNALLHGLFDIALILILAANLFPERMNKVWNRARAWLYRRRHKIESPRESS